MLRRSTIHQVSPVHTIAEQTSHFSADQPLNCSTEQSSYSNLQNSLDPQFQTDSSQPLPSTKTTMCSIEGTSKTSSSTAVLSSVSSSITTDTLLDMKHTESEESKTKDHKNKEAATDALIDTCETTKESANNATDSVSSSDNLSAVAPLSSLDSSSSTQPSGKTTPKWRRKLLLWLSSIMGVIGLGLCFCYFLAVYWAAPDLTKFQLRSNVLYDKSGQIIYEMMTPDDYHRILTRVEDVDPIYLKMLLSSEDERFWEHYGVDPISVVRAAVSNFISGKRVSGASTLAMQVCRLLEPKERNLLSKFKEALGALYLTHKYGREQILTMYLTLTPFGGNIEGVTAASYSYFNHSPARLTPAEAALLVALPRSPEKIRPDRHHMAALYYRNEVLVKAVNDGVIKEDILQSATREGVPQFTYDLPQDALHLGQSLFAGKLHEMLINLESSSAEPMDQTMELQPLLEKTVLHKSTSSATSTSVKTSTQDNQKAQTIQTAQHSTDSVSSQISLAAQSSHTYQATQNSQIASMTKSLQTSQATQNLQIDPAAQSSQTSLSAQTTSYQSAQQSIESTKTPDNHYILVPQYNQQLLRLRFDRQGRRLPTEVYTTIDPEVQQVLNQVLKSYQHQFLQGLDEENAAMLAVDNQSFEVLGYACTDHSFVDVIQAVRSPGSSLKPFVYAMAFEEGLVHPNSILLDMGKIYRTYQPRNYDRMFFGEITASKALQTSLNLPAIEVMRAVGPVNFVNRINAIDLKEQDSNLQKQLNLQDQGYIKGRLKLMSNAEPHLGVILGACGISLYDLTQMYAALAHDGQIAPLQILNTQQQSPNRKQLLIEHSLGQSSKSAQNNFSTQLSEQNQVQFTTFLNPDSARMTYEILEGLPKPAGFNFDRELKISYKTGTSFKYRDTSVIGTRGRITIGVWQGRTDGSPSSLALSAYQKTAPMLFKALTMIPERSLFKPQLASSSILEPQPPIALEHLEIRSLGKTSLRRNNDLNHSENFTHGLPLEIVYPSDGMQIQAGLSGRILLQIQGGKPPYYVLINDEPQNENSYFTPEHNGIYTITAIDSTGNSQVIQVLVKGLMTENQKE